jgi:hypothetical protein
VSVSHPADLAEMDGVATRSAQSGPIRSWTMRNARDMEAAVEPGCGWWSTIPKRLAGAALMGASVAMIAIPHAVGHLESGARKRLFPHWHAEP